MAIGSFDGVHLGHQALLALARADADARGAEAGALTFDPHPARHFAPALAPPLIQPLARRLELLLAAGADFVVVERFDADLARLSPQAFVDQVLVDGLGAAHVVVGHDFSFGQGRAGTAATLVELGRQRGFAVTVVAAGHRRRAGLFIHQDPRVPAGRAHRGGPAAAGARSGGDRHGGAGGRAEARRWAFPPPTWTSRATPR